MTKARCLKVGVNPDPHVIAEAAALLKQDELVAFPTETVYGLGGNAMSHTAIDKIFAAKRRPSDNPLIVHVADLDGVARFAEDLPPILEAIAEHFWPGPLTVILKAREEARRSVTRGLPTIALRVPNHPVALALLKAADLGVAAPSANLSGRPSPTRAEHVMQDLGNAIPMVLDGGPCRFGIESTVLDLSREDLTVLRPGAISAEALSEKLGVPVTYSDDSERKKRSPGTRYRHYSPETPVVMLGPDVTRACLKRLIERGVPSFAYLGRHALGGIPNRQADEEEMASWLYQSLREWDLPEVDLILVQAVDRKDVTDRLSKAATFFMTDDQALTSFFAQLTMETQDD